MEPVGLDAYVGCTCYAEGKVQAFEPAELVAPDDEGRPRLTVSWSGNEELHQRFDEWLKTACPHPRMQAASERISNWAGYRVLQEAMGRIGWERFPSLKQGLPEGNGGAMFPIEARKALGELDTFEREVAGMEEALLIDSDSGERVYDYVASYQGIFVWAGSRGVEIGFDPDGVFLRRPERDGGEELFRAMRVEVTEDEFVDRDTGRRVACPAAWGAGRRFHVDVRPMAADRFDYVVAPLRRVFRAAVATGNPVIWC
jgi:hypothetical protein